MAGRIDIKAYSGPLDLLNHLLEEQRWDIHDIPIQDITEQYLEILGDLEDEALDVYLASEFLLMAATLLQIKTRMLLPDRREAELPEDDPRDDLVLRLLAYRRLKHLATVLEGQHARYVNCFLKAPETAHSLGLTVEVVQDPAKYALCLEAAQRMHARNEERFNARAAAFAKNLKRERFSVRAKLKEVLDVLKQKTRLFFHELFPSGLRPRAERVAAFLAVLELLKEGAIRVRQERSFAVLLIEARQRNVETFSDGLEAVEEYE